jgi:dTDP-4-dehydrorhamnose 3,5-epimerase
LNRVDVYTPADHTDGRGFSFSLPNRTLVFLGSMEDIHITTLRPGQVRGNHYHSHHKEIVCVLFHDKWSLHYDAGPGTPIEVKEFSGEGARIVEVAPLCGHAVRNDGAKDLFIIGLSNLRYDERNPDTSMRVLAAP